MSNTPELPRDLQRALRDKRSGPPIWVIVLVGIPVGLMAIVFVALMAFGYALELQLLPPTEVLAGKDLADRHHDKLREAGIVKPDEQIEYFYSEALFDVTKAGNVLTNRRVISYEIWDGEFALYEAGFDEIVYLGADPGNFLDDTILYVGREDEEDFMLFLSTEAGGDRKFVDALASRADIAVDHEYRYDAPAEWTTEELQQTDEEIGEPIAVDAADAKTAEL